MPDDSPIHWKQKGYNPDFIRSVLARQQVPKCGSGPVTRIPGVPLWVSDLINEIARKHCVRVARIIGKDRSSAVVIARNEVLYEVRRRNPRLSFPKIGLWFGRDHTAVMFAIASHARRNNLPKLTEFDLDRHSAARKRFIEKRRVKRGAAARNIRPSHHESESQSGVHRHEIQNQGRKTSSPKRPAAPQQCLANPIRPDQPKCAAKGDE